ncbi:hypothetical protein AVEN_82907-1 [Araneus ventricosus]|nr:hypothetical protein AVEN_82907-1 [Araneus ventricosus]
MTGHQKLKPLVIGRSKNPRCFKDAKSLGLDYDFNKKSRMASEICKKWVQNLDKRMIAECRKIALVFDNCPAHPKEINQKLKNVIVFYLLPNTASKLQPMDQGVIKKNQNIVAKVYLWVYNVNSPTRRIMENEGLFTNMQENTAQVQETIVLAQITNVNRQQFTGHVPSPLLRHCSLPNLKTHITGKRLSMFVTIYYRKKIVLKVITALENNQSIPKINLRESISEISKAWNCDVTDCTIRNSFAKAGFFVRNENSASTEDEDGIPLEELKKCGYS